MAVMKKVKLIYNPFSGSKTFRFDLDICVTIFQQHGYEVHIFRTLKPGDIENHVQEMPRDYDIIVISGGDGTINLLLNAMMKNDLHIPIGIIPSGTANDFATFLGLKVGQTEECCRIIATTEPKDIDVGIVNGENYFINVCAGGLLTNVSQTVDTDVKNVLGNLSYYLKGVEQLPQFSKIPFRITTSDGQIIEEKLYLYMVLNSAGTGGFEKLAPEASITDGKFDFIGIRAKPVVELPILLLKILTGEFTSDSGVVYLRDSSFKIECLKENFKIRQCTLDGEQGPSMPLEVHVLPKAVSVFGKFKY